MIGPLLRLYPRRYRIEAGQEILAVHRESMVGARVADRLREAADIAGHALRMRIGVTSSSAAGRLLAQAAPQVAGVAAAYCGLHLSRWYTAASLSPGFPPLEADGHERGREQPLAGRSMGGRRRTDGFRGRHRRQRARFR